MRHLLLFIAGVLMKFSGVAQLGVGTGETLRVQSGTIFSVDSLVFIPTVNMAISNNALTHNYVPVPGINPGTNSIARVYYLTSNIPFTGSLGIIYSDAELAGNTEGALQIAYRTGGTTWTTTAGSAVNTVTNYITYPAPGISFGITTATTSGVALPIAFNAFAAALKPDYVQLNWDMGDVEHLAGFNIEFSNDGRTWSKAGNVIAGTGQREFSYRHNDLNFTLRYYRIVSVDRAGKESYSRIMSVKNGAVGAGMTVLRLGSNHALLYFHGQAPSSLEVFNIKGQLLMKRTVNQQQADVQGLVPGIYVVRYIIDGQKVAKQIQF